MSADWSSLFGPLVQMGLTGLGTAMLGPPGGAIGGAVGATIARALGVAETPEAVHQAITTDPAGSAEKLRDLEGERQHALAMFQTQTADTLSARQMNMAAVQASSPTEWVPPILAFLLTLMVFSGGSALFFIRTEIPANLFSLLNIMYGAVLAAWGQSVNFYFGTSRSSEKNGAVVRSIAASSNIPSPAQQVTQALAAARR